MEKVKQFYAFLQQDYNTTNISRQIKQFDGHDQSFLEITNLQIKINHAKKSCNAEEQDIVGSGLQQLTNLSCLFIELDKCSFDDISQFGEGFKGLSKLEVLKLRFHSKIIPSQMQKLGESFKHLKLLKQLVLYIEECSIQEQGALGIGDGIRFLDNLQTLIISIGCFNNIGKEGAKRIALGIQNMKQLNKLSLSLYRGNHIKSDFCHQIGTSLKNLTLLKELSLYIGSNNQVEGVLGVRSISEGLKQLKQLEILSLSIHQKNQLDGEAYSELGKSLKYMDNLQRLNITFSILEYQENDEKNYRISEGILGLAQGLKHLKQLNYLTLKLSHYEEDVDLQDNIWQGLSELQNLKTMEIRLQLEYVIPLIKECRFLNKLYDVTYSLSGILESSPFQMDEITIKKFHQFIDNLMEIKNLSSFYYYSEIASINNRIKRKLKRLVAFN